MNPKLDKLVSLELRKLTYGRLDSVETLEYIHLIKEIEEKLK